MPTREKPQHLAEDVYWSLLFGAKRLKVTPEQVAYFTEHPDEIEEYSSSINIHSIFLLLAGAGGAGLVALSKYIKFSALLMDFGEATSEFIVDIIFEVGVAMIGAVATAYFLGVLLNRQQKNAAAWRAEIRRIIDENAEQAGQNAPT